MTTSGPTDRRLAALLPDRLLLASRNEGDYLVLADAVLLAAIEGRRNLGAGERAALVASPLTLRRFRALCAARGRQTSAANDAWSGSGGMLRAASDASELAVLATDDGCWTLHFVAADRRWRVILAVDGGAPFAARLVREQSLLRVLDGDGAVVLQGRLDADGECECSWPFGDQPAAHFQARGARFAVEPVTGQG